MIRIEVVTAARSGFVVATETTEQPPGSGYDWSASGTAVVVGQVYRSSADGEQEEWRAWLWPAPTTYPPTGQHATAITAYGLAALAKRLSKQHQAKGPWWT